MKVRKTITMDSRIAEVLDANCLRHGDVTWHVENALRGYFSELSEKKSLRAAKAVSRFVEPTSVEASMYFESKGSSLGESAKFVDFYSSKGWMVGKTKMKDWKAAARNWISRNKTSGESYGQSKRQSLSQRSGNAREQLFAQIDAEEATSGVLGANGQPLRL